MIITPACHAPDRPVLYFVHIPKTAGTSLKGYTDGFYFPNSIFPAEISLYGGADVPFMRQLGPDTVNSSPFIRGHHAVEHLQPLLAECAQPVARFTVVREPAAQLLSEYNMALHDRHYPRWAELQKNPPSFDEYLELPWFDWIRNRDRQCYHLMRQLIGPDQALPPKDEWLDRVLESLEHYEVVGVHEQLQQTVQLLADRFGWSCPQSLPHLNPGRKKSGLQLSQSQRDRVREENSLDYQLYEWAQQRLEKDYAALLRRLKIDPAAPQAESLVAQRITSCNQRQYRSLDMRAGRHGGYILEESQGLTPCYFDRQHGRQLKLLEPSAKATQRVQFYGMRPTHVVLEIVAWHHQCNLDSLQIFANGRPLHYERKQFFRGCLVTARLNADLELEHSGRLELRVTTEPHADAPSDNYPLAIGSLRFLQIPKLVSWNWTHRQMRVCRAA